jgi:hypothetical protein
MYKRIFSFSTVQQRPVSNVLKVLKADGCYISEQTAITLPHDSS